MKSSMLILFLCLTNLVRANVVGTEAQNFNPTTSGLDFVTVHSSETLKPGYINFGLFGNYAEGTLPRLGAARTQYNDQLWSSDVNVGVGILKDWDAGVNFPSILNQSIDNQPGFKGQFSKKGNTEIKFNSKYRLAGDDSTGIAIVGSVNFNLIHNNPYSGENPAPTYNLELAADRTFGKVAAAFNFGHRWRNPGTPIVDVPIQPLRNQFIASVAASYLIPEADTKIIFETFGSRPVDTADLIRNPAEDSLEALLGAKYDATQNLAFHAGVGRELITGISSPNIRFYAGLNLAIGPVFSKNDEKTNPEIRVVESTPDSELFLTRRILFKFNSSEMMGSYEKTLRNVANYLAAFQNYRRFVIEGHTDSVGKAEYNQKLSESRASAIRAYLIQNFNLEPGKVQAIGYGESMPIADNGNFQGRQENRRVEFRVEK